MKPIPPRGNPWSLALPIVLSLIYGASPIDLVPDLIPLLGWMDDGIVALFLVGYGFIILAKRRRAQARNVQPALVTNLERAA
ncbi:MAG: DUF1232 domain-containing protein [Fimbriimonadaceae bacterium]|nr:DUF1232 domain-containing protein [Fimbriimonadaceae bacterium]QYK57398.1 MAG: DUF1232 domain-containing protein [Fimbriimonadaceae bacterium]